MSRHLPRLPGATYRLRALLRAHREHAAPYSILVVASASIWVLGQALPPLGHALSVACGALALGCALAVVVTRPRDPARLLLVVSVSAYAAAVARASSQLGERPWLGPGGVGLLSRLWVLAFLLAVGVAVATLAGIPHWTRMRDERALQKPEDEQAFPGVSWLRDARWESAPAPTATGWARTLRLPPGGSARKFVNTRTADMAGVLASSIELTELREGVDASLVTVLAHQVDALATPRPWPPRVVESFSLWDPVPVGVDRCGDQVLLPLVGRHLLVAGESGSGKSVLQSMIVTAAALDRTADLILLDGKGVDLPGWAPRASRYVGPDPEAAVELLGDLQQSMDARYAELAEEGKRKVAPGDRLTLLMVDELASFMLAEPRVAKEFGRRLLDLLQRGRAAGLVVVAATQRPSTKLLSGDLRDAFTLRVALRTSSSDGSRMVLGEGAEADASRLDPDRPGLAWLVSSSLRMVRSYWLSDEDLLALQRRTTPVHAHTAHAAASASSASVATPTADELEAWLQEPATPPVADPVRREPEGRPCFPDGSLVASADRPLWLALAAHDGPMTVQDLVEAQDAYNSWTPVDTRLKRWARAGYVTPTKVGRANAYEVANERQASS